MHYAINLSSVSPELPEKEIEDVLKYTQAWNNSHEITGLLLYSDGNFFQVMEGEKSKIDNLFNQIKVDRRYQNIIKIFERPIHREAFDGYESDFVTKNTRYNEKDFEHYLNYIRVLDENGQKAVKNILKAFIV